MNKPIASISLDLDDLWSYQRTHGDPDWERRGSYLPELMPVILDLLERQRCRITFFVVGADAAAPANHPWLRMITDRGHEVGNHSFQHETWMHRNSAEEIAADIAAAEDAIAEATGERPRGFRGPGFTWSPTLLEVVAQRGYAYDASTLPTYLGPLARAYFLATASLDEEQRRRRRELFGGFRDGMRPAGAYRWRLPSGRPLLEIPVTTIPGIKTPFHMSYLIYLSRYSRRLMWGYLHLALELCRRTGTTPSFLLHPLDVLGPEDASSLAFFPGMDVPAESKRTLVRDVLRVLGEQFSLVPMSVHAAQAVGQNRLAVLEPHGRRLEAHG